MPKIAFSTLPSTQDIDRMLKISEVAYTTSFSRATIYRKIADGSFPKPVKIGTARVAWRRADIVNWLASRKACEELSAAA